MEFFSVFYPSPFPYHGFKKHLDTSSGRGWDSWGCSERGQNRLWWSLWLPPNSGYSIIPYFRSFHSLALCSIGTHPSAPRPWISPNPSPKGRAVNTVTRTGALAAPVLQEVTVPMTCEIWQTACLLFLSSHVRGYLDTSNSRTGNTIASLFISVGETTGTSMMLWKTSQKVFIQ